MKRKRRRRGAKVTQGGSDQLEEREVVKKRSWPRTMWKVRVGSCDVSAKMFAPGDAAQVASLYHLYSWSSKGQSDCIQINPAYSDGMNGFLCLRERNNYNTSVSFPVGRWNTVENNRVLNATYLNPRNHQHIPEPPEVVVMLMKIVKPQDIKPFPVLWHEDNCQPSI
ncbi:uncharacterized protein A4U43_C07F33340 [Asparagus officinalis]|uniref:Xrn1 helical domain-containing protein n=1 Tax=Asparagus officinalis TaxID=4686 RepID=A0A5P1EGP7_ASPOF|nr:uncharacterized protein A4U43_C07F33340 [Asparagus officinalis]